MVTRCALDRRNNLTQKGEGHIDPLYSCHELTEDEESANEDQPANGPKKAHQPHCCQNQSVTSTWRSQQR